MSCTNDLFQLEKDVPNVYVSFHVSPAEIQKALQKNETIEVNYKRLYRRLTGRKRTLTNELKVVHQTPIPNAPSAMDERKSSNRFDTFIDKLERKYIALSNIQSSADGVMGSEGEDSASNLSASSAQTSPESKNVIIKSKSSKKKANPVQDYDYEDPFIDDSEVVNELEEAISRKKLKTKHDGFFVSSGDLEVVKVKKVVVPKPTQPQAQPTSQTEVTNATVPKEDEPIEKAPKAVKPSKESSKSKDGEEKTPKQPKAPKDPSQTSNKSASEPKPAKSAKVTQESNQNKSVPSSEKAPPILKAATAVSLANIPSIPSVVVSPPPSIPASQTTTSVMEEDYFHASPHHPDAQPQPSTTGEPKKEKPPKPAWQPNNEVIQALEKFKLFVEQNDAKPRKNHLFPTILEEPLVQLDSFVKQFHSQEELNKTSGYYEEVMSVLGKSSFSPSKIRTLVLRIEDQRKANKLFTKLFDEFIPTLTNEIKAAIVPCPAEKQPANKKPRKSVGSGGDGSNIPLGSPVAASLNPATITENNNLGNDAPEEEQQQQTADNMELSQQGPSKPTIEYVWFIQWSIPMKQKLIELENLVNEWVAAENLAREKIPAADRKLMKVSEVSDSVRKAFVSLFSSFFSCFILCRPHLYKL
jgi:hypothetical protein